jgi:hypothetical protein
MPLQPPADREGRNSGRHCASPQSAPSIALGVHVARAALRLDLWFPSLGCDDLVVDIIDGSSSEPARLSEMLFARPTDARGVAHAPARRMGPSEQSSLGMRLWHALEAFARAQHELAATQACSTECASGCERRGGGADRE